MKVLMITSLPENLKEIKGGVDAVVMNLIKGFEYYPSSQLLILSLAKADKEYRLDYAANIAIQYFPRNKFLGGNLVDFLVFARKKVRRIIGEFGPDVIHIQGGTPVLFCLRGMKKDNIVITQHGIMAEEIKYQKGIRARLKFYFKKLVEKYYFPNFQNYICISQYNQCFLEKIKSGGKFEKSLIFNPVNPIFFGVKPRLTFQKRLLYVGVINRRKNLLCLLKALRNIKARISGIEVLVVGGYLDGNYKCEIDEFIVDNDLVENVKFLGWKEQAEVLELYKDIDVFVLPSLQESLPVSIAEAMAAGRPIIASRVGGVAEMFTNDKSGFSFEPDDEKELEKYLLAICSGEKEYDQLSNNARLEAMEKFHPRRVVEKTLDFYARIISS